jgi:hypothetical protein
VRYLNEESVNGGDEDEEGSLEEAREAQEESHPKVSEAARDGDILRQRTLPMLLSLFDTSAIPTRTLLSTRKL